MMMPQRIANAFFGAILILFAFAPEALAQQATLTGRVIDASTNQPLPGANVVLTAPGSDRMLLGGATDSDGRYRLTGITPGQYVVAARFIGYAAGEHTITLAAGESRSLDFAIAPGGVDLATVIVTASRQAEKVLDAPASISVLGVREIESDVAANTSDVLRNTVGVDMAQTGVNRREIVLRGFNNAFSGQAYVLTDNRKAAVPSLGVNVHSIMPNMGIDTERIEVVRGPGSALYGPGVDAGVIHFISKDPFTYPGTTVAVSGGERSFFGGQLRHAGNVNNRFGYKVTGSYTRADDWEMDPSDPADASQLDNDFPGLSRSYEHYAYNVNGLLAYRFADNVTLTANAGYSELKGIVLSGIGTLQAEGFGYTYGQLRLTAGDLFAQLYVNRNNAGDSFVYGTSMPVVDNGIFYNAQAQYNWFVNDNQSLIFGVDGQVTTPDTDGTILGRNEGENITEVGVYAQSQSRLTEQLDVTVALRADYNDVVDALRLSPRAALVFKPTPTQSIRATFNRAFSSPGTNSNFLDIMARAPDAALPIGIRARGAAYGFSWQRDASYSAFSNTDLIAASLNPATLGARQPVGLGLNPVYASVYAGLAATPAAQLQAVLASQGLNLTVEQIQGLVALLSPAAGTNVQGFSQGNLALLNPAATRPEDQFVPISDVSNVEPLKQTTTQTFEVGYKGALTNRFVLEVDLYHTQKENFIGPLLMETPMVFVPNLSADLAAALTAGIQGNAQLMGALNQFGLPPQMVAQLLVGLAGPNLPSATTPVAVVIPAENDLGPGSSPELMLSYRNFGRVSYFGSDIAAQYVATDNLNFFGNLSWTSDNFFTADELGEDNPDLVVSLNAPKIKARLGFSARTAGGFLFGAAGRYTDGFPVRSGPYVGEVDSFFLLDANVGFDFHRHAPGLRFDVTVQNVLNEDQREFVGAPRLGRMALARLTYTL
jgi:outer membrane receptor for ferrienterochelin and colicins